VLVVKAKGSLEIASGKRMPDPSVGSVQSGAIKLRFIDSTDLERLDEARSFRSRRPND
jgi:hypothetical protein